MKEVVSQFSPFDISVYVSIGTLFILFAFDAYGMPNWVELVILQSHVLAVAAWFVISYAFGIGLRATGSALETIWKATRKRASRAWRFVRDRALLLNSVEAQSEESQPGAEGREYPEYERYLEVFSWRFGSSMPDVSNDDDIELVAKQFGKDGDAYSRRLESQHAFLFGGCSLCVSATIMYLLNGRFFVGIVFVLVWCALIAECRAVESERRKRIAEYGFWRLFQSRIQ